MPEYAVRNTSRGELSTADSISGGLLALWTHLVEDGETPPLVLTEDDRPVAVINWMAVGGRSIARLTVDPKEARR